MAATKAALSQVHGIETLEREFSDDYLASELDAITPGMWVALPEEQWRPFRTLPVGEFAAWLRELAGQVRLARFKKPPRGPKKPSSKRIHDPKKPHVSTAKVIAARKHSKAC